MSYKELFIVKSPRYSLPGLESTEYRRGTERALPDPKPVIRDPSGHPSCTGNGRQHQIVISHVTRNHPADGRGGHGPGIECPVLTDAAPRLASSITPSTLISPQGPQLARPPWHRDHKGVRLSRRVEMFHDKNRQDKPWASSPPPAWTTDLGPFIGVLAPSPTPTTGLLE